MHLTGWPVERRAGAMAFHALHAALAAIGIERSLDSLVTCSGEAFCLTWCETAPAHTLRHTRPIPTFSRAADLAKVRVAIRAERTPPSAVAALQKHTAAGRLVLAPLFEDARIGVVQTVDSNGIALVVGPDRLEPEELDVSHGWSGAFPGVATSYGLYGVVRRDCSTTTALTPAPDLAATLVAVTGDAGSASSVRFGLAAMRAAAEAVRAGAALHDAESLERLLIFFEQTEFGFGCAERWFGSGEAADVSHALDLAQRARSLRATAGELAERLWDPVGTASASALGRAVLGRKSVVFELPANLEREPPGQVIELARGRAVIVDTRTRRAALSRLADAVERAAELFVKAAGRIVQSVDSSL